MTTLERLESWRMSGAIRDDQFAAISALVRKQRFSVFLELNILLYLGVMAFVAGAGWTIRIYFANVGDITVLSVLSILVAASFYYCFSRTTPYSNLQVESPNLGFDYILYLGCLLLGIELGYLEVQFQLLSSQWEYHLLFSALVFFACAYRFDNRFVLSLALSTLAAWLGVRISRFSLFEPSALRASAIAFSIVVVSAGLWLHRMRVKAHFLETYLHIGTNVLLVALVSGIGGSATSWCLPALLIAAGVAFWAGVRHRRFAFVVYAVVYGYIGISIELMRNNREFFGFMAYLVVSGAAVVVGLFLLARRMGNDS